MSAEAVRRRATVLRSCRPWCVLLIGLAGLLFGGELRAQPASEPAEPSASEKETARHLLDVGDEKFGAGDFQGALEAYRAADEIMRVPTTGLALGKAQERLGLLVEARDTLLRVTRYPKAPDESAIFAQARAEAATLAQALVERIPTVQIQVAGLAASVAPSVRVDGTPVRADTLKFPRRVSPGEHRITATAPGYLEAERTITVAERARVAVELTLSRDPDAPAEPTPPPASAPAAGEPAPPAPSPPPPVESGGVSPWVWVGFGIGAAGLVAGTVTGAIALSKADTIRETCGGSICNPDEQDSVDKARAIAHGSTASFAVGGAGVALGVIALLWLSDDDAPAPPAPAAGSLRPWLGLGAAGLEGTFR